MRALRKLWLIGQPEPSFDHVDRYLVTNQRVCSSLGSRFFGRSFQASCRAVIVSGQSLARRPTPVFGRGNVSQPESRSRWCFVSSAQSLFPRPQLIPSMIIAGSWPTLASMVALIIAAESSLGCSDARFTRMDFRVGFLNPVPNTTGLSSQLRGLGGQWGEIDGKWRSRET